MEKPEYLLFFGFALIVLGFIMFAVAGAYYQTYYTNSSGFAFSFFVFPFPVIFVGGRPEYLVTAVFIVALAIFIIFMIIYIYFMLSAYRKLKSLS
ncbi:MAG: hypothetical protein ACP5GH_02575 [Nitrososphaeria archaeon]|jgi:uncharacterized membrane protein